ncbi:MAG: hypothetical protein HYW86_00620 [Candidatus Roizmanbacteria bacterium]|nr:MAG: hypothetical protein HYW86_00620 [Candidatus Roizmanbacteria bacterium]
MKLVGYILISIGISLLIFVVYNLIQDKGRIISPVPEEKGVKVIFVTPAK